jgi:hypothetical protein
VRKCVCSLVLEENGDGKVSRNMKAGTRKGSGWPFHKPLNVGPSLMGTTLPMKKLNNEKQEPEWFFY